MKKTPPSNFPTQRRPAPRAALIVLVLAALLLLLAPRLADIWFENLWFSSLGIGGVFTRTLLWRWALFFAFAILTFAILRAVFAVMERAFASFPLGGTLTRFEGHAITIAPRQFLRPAALGIALFWALICGLTMSLRWQTFVLFFVSGNGAASTRDVWRDPVFARPVEFYFFALPFFTTLAGWLWSLAVLSLLATLAYGALALISRMGSAQMLAARTLSLRAISLALGVILLIASTRVFLDRFGLTTFEHGTIAGLNYVQWHVSLPAMSVIAALLFLGGALCFLNAALWKRRRVLALAVALPFAVAVVTRVQAAYVANFVVKPNELARETPSIENNIAATRRAFGLDKIEERTFGAQQSVAALDAKNNPLTLENVRLWDWQALQATLRQNQVIGKLYDFPDVDVDRYQIGGQPRQLMLAARELNIDLLPSQTRNWINDRLIYTHGYGVVAVAANAIEPNGKPRYLVSDIPVQNRESELEVTRPQIYFGQLTDTTVYVKTAQREFDYPRGNGSATSVYDGKDGIEIGSGLRRLAISYALGDLTKVPFSSDIRATSRVLVHRDITERVGRIAPFLSYDGDPYIVIGPGGHLFWMLDAFTTTSYFPMASSYDIGNDNVNYARNSVKVTIDAYDGTTRFYVFDDADPILRAWRRFHPELFVDGAQMPPELRAHVRYPESLFRLQAEVFALYHLKTAKAFFGRDDIWSVAASGTDASSPATFNAPRASLPGGAPSYNGNGAYDARGAAPYLPPPSYGGDATIDPYFVLMRLPGEGAREEFAQVLPFTPAGKPNMVGWLAARSDGDNYGGLVAYDFPKSASFDGPAQVRARIDQQPELSGQLTLWNQQGSNVLRGNLLVIPMGSGLLYVEPIFLKASQSPQPELRLVVLATQDKLVYDSTYAGALKKLLGSEAPATQAPSASTREIPSPNSPPQNETTRAMIDRAAADLEAYQKLTSEGNYAAAGKRLESLRGTLQTLREKR